MKKFFPIFPLLAFFLLLSGCKDDHKVNICHKGKIICVDYHAVRAHQAHGDAVDLDGDGYFEGDNKCTDPDCDDTDPNVNPGEDNCAASGCSITLLEVLNATCTDPLPSYDLQLRITYDNPPAAGTLDVTIDGNLTSFPIGTSPQTVNVFGLPPTGVGVDVTVSFSDDPECILAVDDLYVAPDCGL